MSGAQIGAECDGAPVKLDVLFGVYLQLQGDAFSSAMRPAIQVPVRLRDLASASPTEEVATRVVVPPPDDGYSTDDSSDSSFDGYDAQDRGQESSDSDSDDSIDGAEEPAWVAAGESYLLQWCFSPRCGR